FLVASGRRRTRSRRGWGSDVCSSDLDVLRGVEVLLPRLGREGIPAVPVCIRDEVGIPAVRFGGAHEVPPASSPTQAGPVCVPPDHLGAVRRASRALACHTLPTHSSYHLTQCRRKGPMATAMLDDLPAHERASPQAALAVG